MKDFLSVFFMILVSLYLCVFFLGSMVSILDVYGILLMVALGLSAIIVTIQTQATKIEDLESRLSSLLGEDLQASEE